MSVGSIETPIMLAKRDGNKRRSFLLVNPRQAKHIPTRPKDAWAMMASLAHSVGPLGSPGLVIAFAETATAIGAVVATGLGADWRFVHSTRAEKVAGRMYVDFEESHSHSTGHHLCVSGIEGLLAEGPIVFVDDEYSTGQTLCNAIDAISSVDACSGKTSAVAVIDRIGPCDRAKLQEHGVSSVVSLCRCECDDLEDLASKIGGKSPEKFRCEACACDVMLELRNIVPDPRAGVVTRDYLAACEAASASAVSALAGQIGVGDRVVVLGTEECMFPALLLAKMFESECSCEAYCHATTRSPILVSAAEKYPIRNGYSIRSLYDPSRETFIYNVRPYDVVVIVTDASGSTLSSGLADLSGVFSMGHRTKTVVVAI